MGKPVLYTGADSIRGKLSSSRLRASAREFVSLVRLTAAEALTPGEHMSEAELRQINHRMDRLLFVRHLIEKGTPAAEAIELSGVPRNTWYRWNVQYRRSCGNPRSLADRSRAPHTKRERTAWTPFVEWYVLQRRAKAMMSGALLAFFLAVETGGKHKASARTMARIVAHLRDEKQVIKAAERGKNVTRTGSGRHWVHDWIDRLKGKRRLKEELGHFEIDHLVLNKTETSPAARVFVAVDKITNWVFIRAYADATSAAAAEFLQELLDEAGIIRSVQTVNGSEFKGAFTDWLKARGIKQKAIKAGSPTWNNQVENINNMLRMRCFNFHRDDEKDFNGLQLLIRRFCHEFNHTPYFGNPLPPPELFGVLSRKMPICPVVYNDIIRGVKITGTPVPYAPLEIPTC